MPNTTEILPLASRKYIARFAVKDTELKEVASAEVGEAKPPLTNKIVLDALAAREFREVALQRLVAVGLPIGVFLVFLVIALKTPLVVMLQPRLDHSDLAIHLKMLVDLHVELTRQHQDVKWPSCASRHHAAASAP